MIACSLFYFIIYSLWWCGLKGAGGGGKWVASCSLTRNIFKNKRILGVINYTRGCVYVVLLLLLLLLALMMTSNKE
jgi:hypothetical protein